MKKTLTTNEINGIITDTIARIEAKKGTNSAPYLKMDLSIYTSDTLEAIKEAFVAAGIRFDDRWNNGSDFVVPIDTQCAPPTFRSGRRDSFTRSDGPICDPGQAKKPLNLGRRDAGTVDPRNPMRDSVHQPKKPSHLGRSDAGTVSGLIANATKRSEATIGTGDKGINFERVMD